VDQKGKKGVWNRFAIGEVAGEQIIGVWYQPKGEYERWGKAGIDRCLPLISPRPGELILDLACGFGTFTYLCAKEGAEVVGLDISEACLRGALDACSRLVAHSSYHFVLGDVTRLPFAGASFDKVVSIDGFEHFTWSQKRTLVAEAHRVLKPGGIFVVYTPNLFTKAIKVLRLNLINLALCRLNRLISTTSYLAEREPTHIGMTSPFKLRRLFKRNRFTIRFYYSTSGGKKKRSGYRALIREKLPLLRDVLNGRIAIVAARVGSAASLSTLGTRR
jgi:ubiquinone/menaquinone biosynthesis C-methylase UbiE